MTEPRAGFFGILTALIESTGLPFGGILFCIALYRWYRYDKRAFLFFSVSIFLPIFLIGMKMSYRAAERRYFASLMPGVCFIYAGLFLPGPKKIKDTADQKDLEKLKEILAMPKGKDSGLWSTKERAAKIENEIERNA